VPPGFRIGLAHENQRFRQRGSPAAGGPPLCGPLITLAVAVRGWMEDSIFVASLGRDVRFGHGECRADSCRRAGAPSQRLAVAPWWHNGRALSMLPVSGAEQLKASGAMCERPMISHSGAYSRFVSSRGHARECGQETSSRDPPALGLLLQILGPPWSPARDCRRGRLASSSW